MGLDHKVLESSCCSPCEFEASIDTIRDTLINLSSNFVAFNIVGQDIDSLDWQQDLQVDGAVIF